MVDKKKLKEYQETKKALHSLKARDENDSEYQRLNGKMNRLLPSIPLWRR